MATKFKTVLTAVLFSFLLCSFHSCGEDGGDDDEGEICGNGYCGTGENVSNCPGDCGGEGIVCGNGKCEAGENVANCPSDCGGSEAECGNGTCETDESNLNCPSDCEEDLPPPDPGPTWYDSENNYTWQVNPSSEKIARKEAPDLCESYGGDWRAPSISELRSLIRGCPRMEIGGACGLYDHCSDNDCGGQCCFVKNTGHDTDEVCWDECPTNKGPDAGAYWPSEISGPADHYWSSSYDTDHGPHRVWTIDFRDCAMTNGKDDAYLRCVRSGP